MMSRLVVTLTVVVACMSLASIALASDKPCGCEKGGMMGDMVSGSIHGVGWGETGTLMGFGILTPERRFCRIHVTPETRYLVGEKPGAPTDLKWGERVVVHLKRAAERMPEASLVRVLPGEGAPLVKPMWWTMANWPLSGRYPIRWTATPDRWAVWSLHRTHCGKLCTVCAMSHQPKRSGE